MSAYCLKVEMIHTPFPLWVVVVIHTFLFDCTLCCSQWRRTFWCWRHCRIKVKHKSSVCVCAWVGVCVAERATPLHKVQPPPSHPVWHTQISKDTHRWDHSWWDHRVSSLLFVPFSFKASLSSVAHRLFIFLSHHYGILRTKVEKDKYLPFTNIIN